MNTNQMKDYLISLNHEVTEVRILRKEQYMNRRFTGTIISGYYQSDQYDKLISDIQPYEADENTKCIWTTLQACKPSLLARAANRLKMGAKTTTEDANIQAFTVFPIDIDSANPTETSASEDELNESKKRAKEVYRVVTEDLGLPAVKAMSGNGCHILIYIDPLEATPENVLRFKATGDIIKALYGTDPTNYNPSRCWKLYETTTRKGDNIPERPHRRSWLIDFPTEITRIPFAELELSLFNIAPEEIRNPPAKKQKTRKKQSSPKANRLPKIENRNDLETFARELGAVPNSEWKQKADYELCRTHCPLCNRDDYGKLTYGNGGECGYSCHSNTCSGKNFQDLYESKGYEKWDGEPYNPPTRHDFPTNFVYDEPPEQKPIEESEEENIIFPDEAALGEDFFYDYQQLSEGMDEICPAYNFAALLAAITAVVGHRVYISGGKTPLFPTFFQCLVGTTTYAWKSPTLSATTNLIRNTDSDVKLIENINSAEGLVDDFQTAKRTYDEKEKTYSLEWIDLWDEHVIEDKEGQRAFIHIDEMRTLLSKRVQAGSKGIMTRLNGLFSGVPDMQSGALSNKMVAHYPTAGLMGLTTPKWLEEDIDYSDIDGGFLNRFVFYIHEKMPATPFPQEPDEDKLNLIHQFILSSREKFDRLTRFDFDKHAKKEFSKIYEEDHQRHDPNDFSMENLFSRRLLISAKKLALVFALIDSKNKEPIVFIHHWERAYHVYEYWKAVCMKLFTNLAASQRGSQEKLVLEKLTELGNRCKKRDLQRKFGGRMSATDLNSVLTELVKGGEVWEGIPEGERAAHIIRIEG